jgi:hypothetical protein
MPYSRATIELWLSGPPMSVTIVGVDGADPLGQRVLVTGQVLDHPGESGDVPDGGVQLGAAGSDRLHAFSILRFEITWQAGDPAGDRPYRGWHRPLRELGRIQAAQRSQVPIHGVVAAGIPLPGDLGQQQGGVHRGRADRSGRA